MKLLAGKRVLITRPVQQSDGLQSDSLQTLLAAHGAIPIAFPTIAIVPDPAEQARLEQAVQTLNTFDWLIFTSQNAVTLFWECIEKTQIPLDTLQGLKIAAIGPSTGRMLRKRGLSVHVVPDEHIGEAIVGKMGDVRGQKVLLPRAQAARKALVDELAKNGASVVEICVYQTITNQPEPAAWQELEMGVDYATFTSASTVNGFFELLGNRAIPLLNHAVTACIGPITNNALEEYGVKAQVVASQYTAEGLVHAILVYADKMKQEANR